MSASAFVEYHTSNVDVRINAGIAVLSINADEGRVIVSMTPEVLERLELRIQLELARSRSH